MKLIIVKVGTNVITKKDGLLDFKVMESIASQLVLLKKKGISVVLVSSGAVAAGRFSKQKMREDNIIFERQIFASIGQVKLMEAYSHLFEKEGYFCPQVLVTKEDFRDRRHYLCMSACFKKLLKGNMIPIVNENEVVAIHELMFTDNDELAGLIAAMLNVDEVIILTSVDGLLDLSSNRVIPTVTSKDFEQYTSPQCEKTVFGRGGMHTKCRVAHHLASLGITTHIANGKVPDIILKLVDGSKLGTTFEPRKRVSNVKKWISHGKERKKGSVKINRCIEELLKNHLEARSLLPIGITQVTGAFKKGEIIEIRNDQNDIIGYGIAQYGFEKALREIGQKNKKPLVHYDYLFLY